MEQKIELEIRLRELAAQSILEARNEIDVLEVEKSLLTSDQRMNYYAGHLEQQRKKLSNPSLSTTDSGRGSKTENHSAKRTTTADQSGDRRHSRPRSDVVGGPPGGGSSSMSGDTSSPSFSSLSNSQSPSKLSPVSGQSANGVESQASFTSRSHHSRTGLRHSQSSSSARSLSTRVRAKSKRREQLIQNLAKQHNLDCNSVMDSRASVSVSEIRIPLMWRDVDHFKNRGDYKRFAVFCLLKIDSQIYDTQLITDVDRQVTDVTFDDFLVFNNIDYDFELTLEVYSCVYLEQFSFSSTPRKLRDKLTSSIGRAMGKRLATQTASSSYTKELQAYDKSYRFALIASAALQLEDASSSVRTYDLVLMSPSAHNRHHLPTTPTALSRSYHNSSHDYYSSRNAANNYNQTSSQLTSANTSKNANKNTLPLFGHFCCRLFVRPDVLDKNINSALI